MFAKQIAINIKTTETPLAAETFRPNTYDYIICQHLDSGTEVLPSDYSYPSRPGNATSRHGDACLLSSGNKWNDIA